MDDDLYFVHSKISLMSKLKEPSVLLQGEDSLSKIIRQQAINYEQEYAGDTWKDEKPRENSKKMSKTEQKNHYCDTIAINPENFANNQPFSHGRKQLKIDVSYHKFSKCVQQSGKQASGALSNNRKGKIILFEQEKLGNKHSNNSKKQKRPEKQFYLQQKTKKIMHQDVERNLNLQIKRESPTRIRRGEKGLQETSDYLQLSSRNNSESMAEPLQTEQLLAKVRQNYKQMAAQVKQQINMVKFQYIEAERIDLKKIIGKFQAQIRRTKISFRGVGSAAKSNSQSGINLSSMQQDQQPSGTKHAKKQSSFNQDLESKLRRQRQQMKSGFEYGVQSNMDSDVDKLKIKLKKTQQTLSREVENEAEFALKFNKLQKKYDQLHKSYLKIEQKLQRQAQSVKDPMTERYCLLKQRLNFLKSQQKQNKSILSNKIKRLKNQNTILSNENVYISKEIDQIDKMAKQVMPIMSKPNKKIGERTTKNKQNLLIFDEMEVKISYKERPIKTISNTNKEDKLGSHDVKSLQSANSIKSFNSINSKPSIGSFKSTKIESVQNKKSIQFQNSMRNKLKISSPHHLSPPSPQLKQTSILKRFKSEENRGFTLHKKSTSLDVAFKGLQEKYSKHMQEHCHTSDEYYK